MNLKFEGNLVT